MGQFEDALTQPETPGGLPGGGDVQEELARWQWGWRLDGGVGGASKARSVLVSQSETGRWKLWKPK